MYMYPLEGFNQCDCFVVFFQLKSPIIADNDCQMQEARQILLAAIAEGWYQSIFWVVGRFVSQAS